MKKISLLVLGALMVFSLVSFSSCSDSDSDKDKKQVKKIVGTWNFSTSSAKVVSNAVEFDAKITEYAIAEYGVEKDSKITYKFSVDKKYIIEEDGKEIGRGMFEYKKGNLTLTPSAVAPKSTENTEKPEAPRSVVYKVELTTGSLSLSGDIAKDITADLKEEGAWAEIVSAEKEMPTDFKIVEATITSKFNVAAQPK